MGRIVVIGGVAGGATAAVWAKRTDPQAEVVLVEKTAHISQATCSLPYFVAGLIRDRERLTVRTPSQLERQPGVRVLVKTEAVEIDPLGRRVRVRSQGGGEEVLTYDALVLATGSRPRRPDLPGAKLEGVFLLKSVEDALTIEDYLTSRRPARVLVAGAGILGLEMVEAYRRRGLEVGLVEAGERPLGWLHPEVSREVEAVFQRHQVAFYPSSPLEAVVGDGRVEGAVAGGSRHACQLVQLCLGFEPNVELARRAGAEVGPSGALRVDSSQKTSLPSVYACGECAEVYLIPQREWRYLPLANPANRAGQVAGINAAGGSATMPPRTGATAVRCFDRVIAFCGLRHGDVLSGRFGPVATTVVRAWEKPPTQPDAVEALIVLHWERGSGRLLGAELVGSELSGIRLGILSLAIAQGMTLDRLAEVDLPYTPPLSPLWDPLLVAVRRTLRG